MFPNHLPVSCIYSLLLSRPSTPDPLQPLRPIASATISSLQCSMESTTGQFSQQNCQNFSPANSRQVVSIRAASQTHQRSWNRLKFGNWFIVAASRSRRLINWTNCCGKSETETSGEIPRSNRRVWIADWRAIPVNHHRFRSENFRHLLTVLEILVLPVLMLPVGSSADEQIKSGSASFESVGQQLDQVHHFHQETVLSRKETPFYHLEVLT